MTHDAYRQAHAELDLWSNVTAHGASPAPDLTMRSIIGLRDVLNHHHPVDRGGRDVVCAADGLQWADCPDARAILAVVGQPEPDDSSDVA